MFLKSVEAITPEVERVLNAKITRLRWMPYLTILTLPLVGAIAFIIVGLQDRELADSMSKSAYTDTEGIIGVAIVFGVLLGTAILFMVTGEIRSNKPELENLLAARESGKVEVIECTVKRAATVYPEKTLMDTGDGKVIFLQDKRIAPNAAIQNALPNTKLRIYRTLHTGAVLHTECEGTYLAPEKMISSMNNPPVNGSVLDGDLDSVLAQH